ncbi:predicted protein [Pyrenophora tritici-repentis Pt-1C-BFP]|uniref:Uncharacterized protein n=1 Tax=Pyrenophora tritici-repentis (strain Pt-1C-BFP) TaxID=426418 RepID=B2W7R1_PYRTR|nr:uncharacterized protein PTRG_05849 [Pyrenophora tritici-repentis Pt-1C-BFP]EDU48769.1 predicted protein [Pyrenophora tritici-repentis Pt-1C-BFP]
MGAMGRASLWIRNSNQKDGHGSHHTMEFIDYCNQNKILFAVYPHQTDVK